MDCDCGGENSGNGRRHYLRAYALAQKCYLQNSVERAHIKRVYTPLHARAAHFSLHSGVCITLAVYKRNAFPFYRCADSFTPAGLFWRGYFRATRATVIESPPTVINRRIATEEYRYFYLYTPSIRETKGCAIIVYVKG